jgi:hypothetical protein
MAVRNSIFAIPLTSLASATGISATYAAINPLGLPQACWKLRITNDTDEDVTISYDGINNHEYLIAGDILEVYAGSQGQPNNFLCNFAKGTVVWVKGTTGTGTAYLSGFSQLEVESGVR